MTPQEISNNTKYQAALARADAKGIGIVARYTDKSGAFLGCQVQGTEGKQYHVANENNRLTCDCPAASYGNYCMHRAIVTRAEMERAAYWANYSAAIKIIESLGQEETAYCLICGTVKANAAQVCPKCGRDVFPSKEEFEARADAELAKLHAEIDAEDELTELVTGLDIIEDQAAQEQQRVDAAFDALTAKLEIEVADKATQDEARQTRIAKLEAAIIRWQECELTHIDYYQDMLDNLEALKAGAAYKQVTFDMEEVMLSAGRVFGSIANKSAHDVKRHNPTKQDPLIARNDTGPRLYREPLAERVRE